MKFDYLRLPGGVTIPAVRMQVRKSSSGPVVDTAGLVDSGADFSIFPKDIADRIGIPRIEVGTRMVAHGIGGSLDCYLHPVQVRIGGWWKSFAVAFSPDYQGFPVLGRQGFFEKFIVFIDHGKQKFELRDPSSETQQRKKKKKAKKRKK